MSPPRREGSLLRLLNATIQHAVANTKYYEEIIPKKLWEIDSLEEFSHLPLLTRKTVRSSWLEMSAGSHFPDYITSTSGTSFHKGEGSPLLIQRSFDDKSEWQDLLRPKQEESELTPIVLRLASIDNGIYADSTPGILNVPLEKPSDFATIKALLETDFSSPGYSQRIVGVIGTLSRIKLLTTLLDQEKISLKGLNVCYLGVHSQVLTERWHSALKNKWGIAPTELYGISEVRGFTSKRCLDCGYYHLPSLCYLEFVDPIDFHPVSKGYARVIATSFYPLVSLQPMIRYDTEEIVELVDCRCPNSDLPVFEYIGREKSVKFSTIGGVRTLIIDPMKLHNAIDEEAAVNIEPSWRAKRFGQKDIGFPKYKVSHSLKSNMEILNVKIELRWNPAVYYQETDILQRRLEAKVISHTPDLHQEIERGRISLSINLVQPGTLDAFEEA